MRKVTDKQKANLQPFKKGHDPRRNLKGRPKSFDTLRDLAQQLANEKIGEGEITVLQDILYKMATDKRLMKDFLEFAYGKVPLSQIIKMNGDVTISWKDFLDGNGNITNPKTDNEQS